MESSSSDATFVIGRFGQIEDANDSACALLGYPRTELLRLYGSELVLPEDRVPVGLSVEQMRRGDADRRRGRLIRKDGSVVPVDVHARPLPGKRLALVVRACAD
jgi:PAS domain S-box-containing protein